MAQRLFSIKDDLVLKELYSRLTNKELASIFNNQYSTPQIKDRAKALKLKKDVDINKKAQETRNGVWLDWEIEVVKRHYNKDGLNYVANLIPDRTRDSIKHKAQRLGIEISKDIRCYANGPKAHSLESRNKMSASRKGKSFTDEHIENIKLGARRGSLHPMWIDGRSKIPYGEEFSVKLKSAVKKRDAYQCQLCKKKPSWTKLVIHHIDYDKRNSTLGNLVTLCKACHVHHHLNTSKDEQRKEQILFNNYISGKMVVT